MDREELGQRIELHDLALMPNKPASIQTAEIQRILVLLCLLLPSSNTKVYY